jgi:hypothetical protein
MQARRSRFAASVSGGAREHDSGSSGEGRRAKSGCSERLAERSRREEAHVVRAGIEVGLERAAAEAEPKAPERSVTGRRKQQPPSPRAQHTAHLAKETQQVLDVLEHLARPNNIERLVSEGQLFRASQHELDPGMAPARERQRRLSHVTARYERAMRRKLPREVAQPATQI